MQQPADVPKISQDLPKAVKDLRNYIIDLNAWLKYKLNNLEVENFTEASQNEIRVTQNGSPADSATYEYVIKHIADAVSRATELITGHQGGYVVLNPSEKPSEILIMDTDDITTATKVWRWNGAGLGYSSTGYDGTYGLAMTMNGAINADFITAGKITSIELVSSTITGGTININDNFKVDSDGNVEIAGAISWGSENSPVKVQYSIDGSTMWHDTFTAGDTFAKYSYDGGTTYTSAVKIIGTDGAIGPTGTDGSDGVSAYTYIRYSEQSDGTGFVSVPTTLTKYIGIAVTTSGTAPTDKANYTWSKYQGEDASVPGYIKETYIDMTSVTSPYITGTKIIGNDYIEYPDTYGFTFYNYNSATSNICVVIKDPNYRFQELNVGDVIDIGTTKYGTNVANSRTITHAQDYGTYGGYSVWGYTFSGSAVYMESGYYVSKSLEKKIFTIYDHPFENPNTPLPDANIIGGIIYNNGVNNWHGEELMVKASNDANLHLESGKLVLINGGTQVFIEGFYGVSISANAGVNTVTIFKPEFTIGAETYEIVTGVAVGQTTTLRRIS